MDPQSASSSSAISRNNYDVFLSFRGIDTRTTIISHLYLALCSKGLYTFKDSEELEAGQRRSELFDAIEGSRIAILMFSENYARSKWCLDELHKIMDLMGQGKLTVVPIFYHVSPREIRMHEKDNGDKGCCQIAMEEMEETYGKDSETVKRWRKALWEGGDLIGFPLYHGQDEGIVVRDVVESVFKILNRVSLEVAKYPVGIDRHLAALRPLLHIDPHVDDVWMIGIHGQGGAGKTTISKAICNHIADRFDSWCFLPNVRETTLRASLAQLQETLLRELLFDKGLDVSSVDAGKRLIKERLRNKRVLVILDDVDECNQLDALAGDVNWFGKGSRIIITTRNKHVLTSYGMEVYELNLLEKEEADRLFQLHAFGEKKEKINVDGDHINQFVEYAGRLPLALVVLGAFLRGRSECEWEGKLKELAVSLDCTINTVLKISFDGLEENHREMFLDVACFYKGWQIDKVEAILDSCWFSSSIGLAILVERCLITIVDECVEMHDLLAAMGQSIVRDEYLKGNGMLSRVWLYEDFLDILSEDRLMQERQAVKGIVLDYFGELDGEELDGELIKSNSLKGFNKLKVLIFWNRYDVVYPVNLEGPQWFPRELRWLQWPHYLAPAIEFDPSCKLVHLYLPSSKVRQIKAKGLKELKYVNLSGCSSLEMLPNLSGCRKLEDLRLDGCTSLTKLDEAIGSLENLVCLNLARCSELMTVPSLLRSKRLKSLHFYGCLKLKKLPAIMEEQKFLEVLDISKAVINELPDSISNLVAVKKLVLSQCQELTTIPSSIYRMQALEEIQFYGCKKLSVFPRNDTVEGTDVFGFPNLVSFDIRHCVLKDLEFLDDLTCFETLKNLALSHNKFTRVPASISRFKNLEYLWLDWCDRLVEVTELPNVPYIIVANCQHLKTFPSLNTFICRSPESFRVELSGCRSLDSGYIERSLQFEHVRGFVGAAQVGYPGEEFPKWVKFQTRDCHSRYRVSIPPNISRDDLLGLALFISFDPKYFHWESSSTVHVKINGVPLFSCVRLNHIAGGGVHSLFFYIPGKPIVKRDSCGIAVELNGLDIVYLEIAANRVELRRLGIHLLCEREEDDDLIKVCRDEEDGDEGEGDST